MESRKRPESTQQLIADAERMAKPSKSDRAISTRQIVAQSEKLLGRTPAGRPASISRWIIVLVIAAAAMVLARLLLR
jgi:hypothetical protein